MVNLKNQIVSEKAKSLGFDLIGFSKAEPLIQEADKLNKWLGLGYHAKMEYMNKNFDKRIDIKNILPDAKSVISLGMNYYTDSNYSNQKGFGKVSRYAWGKDYHLIIWEKLEQLEEELQEVDKEFKCVSYVDTGPVMDKVWAVKCGIGWLAKHTNIISKEFGSWIFLATIITNYEFSYSQPMDDFCGTCTACIDACPTNAIEEYVVNSNKCISYLTIENKEAIPDEFKKKFDGWIFGCDICQDVCPWNKKFSIVKSEKDFLPVNKEIALMDVAGMTEEDFKQKFETSPIKRAKLNGLKRNAEFLC